MTSPGRRILCLALAAFLTMPFAAPAQAQTLAGGPLRDALRTGGLVIVMRHASSPRERPDQSTANADNPGRERQLDQTGRDTAAAMGAAIRKLGVRVAAVHSSPAYRALETVRLAGLGEAHAVKELDAPGGMSADPATMTAQVAWLRAKVAERPRAGGNVFVITHAPNVTAAFADQASGLADGEALVFRASDAGQPTLLARIRIEAWPELAK